MVQFNLLPDVKIEYMKAERLRRTILGLSLITSLAAIGILVLMLSFMGLQKKHLHDLSSDIKAQSKTLQSKKNIDTVLTVQNQLESLTTLHDTKPAAARLYGYLNSVTPASVTITNMSVDFVAHTTLLSGNSDALSSVNQYVDTLKATGYTVKGDATKKPAFNSVVLSSFGLNTASKEKNLAASYTISFSYDPTIYLITKEVTLTVPSITTHAQLQKPTDLFGTGAQ